MMPWFFRLVPIVCEPGPRPASVLLLAFVALLPAEPLYNAPWIVLGTLGLLRVASGRVRLGSPENRFLRIAFLCIWLPMLASLPDAVNPTDAIRKTASTCIYFLAGIYVIGAYTRFRDLDWVMTGVTAICVFWCLDALWQFHTGADWFGVPHRGGERFTGPFDVAGRLGYVLAGFAPLFFECIRRGNGRWPWRLVLLAPLFTAVALSGSRSAWGALIVATAGYILFLIRWSGPPRWKPKRIAAVAVATVLVPALAVWAKPDHAVRAWKTVELRIVSVAGLWSGDREQIEIATTMRLSIWETAVNMFSAHWLNGVGPRGFRHLYHEYSPERDYFSEFHGLPYPELVSRLNGSRDPPPTSPSHASRRPAYSPHAPILEIAVSTGVLGLLGYVVLAASFLVGLRRFEPDSFRSAYPYALASIVALFPIGGHLSFHGVFSAGLIWWIIIVNASAFAVASRKESKTMPGHAAGA